MGNLIFPIEDLHILYYPHMLLPQHDQMLYSSHEFVILVFLNYLILSLFHI